MNLITGLVRPTRGSIQVLGISPTDPEKLFRVCGYATQFDSFPRGMTGFQFVYSYLRLSGMSHDDCQRTTAFAIGRVNLGDAAHRTTRELAYGQQRLLEIALALATRPRVLLLDEPAAGVPKEESHELFTVISHLSSELTVLFIEHDMDVVFRFASRIIVMVGGRILVQGTPDEVANDRTVREVYLGKSRARAA
jgi:ABC-type branched-subunit amino acid transport system ATPase component